MKQKMNLLTSRRIITKSVCRLLWVEGKAKFHRHYPNRIRTKRYHSVVLLHSAASRRMQTIRIHLKRKVHCLVRKPIVVVRWQPVWIVNIYAFCEWLPRNSQCLHRNFVATGNRRRHLRQLPQLLRPPYRHRLIGWMGLSHHHVHRTNRNRRRRSSLSHRQRSSKMWWNPMGRHSIFHLRFSRNNNRIQSVDTRPSAQYLVPIIRTPSMHSAKVSAHRNYPIGTINNRTFKQRQKWPIYQKAKRNLWLRTSCRLVDQVVDDTASRSSTRNLPNQITNRNWPRNRPAHELWVEVVWWNLRPTRRHSTPVKDVPCTDRSIVRIMEEKVTSTAVWKRATLKSNRVMPVAPAITFVVTASVVQPLYPVLIKWKAGVPASVHRDVPVPMVERSNPVVLVAVFQSYHHRVLLFHLLHPIVAYSTLISIRWGTYCKFDVTVYLFARFHLPHTHTQTDNVRKSVCVWDGGILVNEQCN